ncbi:MAG: hypothetical protein AAB639_01755 [Patescibacteria group bacterium]
MADQKIGTVTHFYDKIGVAVIKLAKGDLKVGDKIKLIAKDGSEFTQEVSSMQIEHANIDIAKARDEFGLKTDNVVKTNSEVVKLQ